MSEPAAREEAPEAYRDAIRGGDRRAVARAITLLESTRPDRAALGQAILELLVPETGAALRVGITGPPGVGKSTFIESLGLELLERGQRVAVLAVDPSSPVTGGSILGDKTRMELLARRSEAFIRPSPSGGSLGGVAHRTRETMLLCEAAGYDVVLVETVGIGQSEVSVASMVDFFLVLLLPGGGDELQGIKKGVMELADCLVVNKADGPTEAVAERTRVDYANALELLRPSWRAWKPRALKISAREGQGIVQVWETVLAHRAALEGSGEMEERRRHQARAWMWSLLDESLQHAFREHPEVAREIPRLEAEVAASKATPAAAARRLMAVFRGGG
ncbi:MAG: methylmalonyl Co-A mutase-associated GTPase MeaB [Deltaproteobacteria bacterium]|nr:methylmalonyl Co-A mutase-associated GTPase MeaB [Deltaproteobacteria bacterium]MBW2417286.1 methylmalonyl Co-A mutase-associated GTPase MeaB [Deltaproteobacteria bacterium]